MVCRKGVGATLTAALLFGLLLLSNLALLSSSRERERLYATSDSESYLYDSAQIISGAISYSLLTKVQTILANTFFDCSTALQTLDSEVGSLSARIDSGVLRASGKVSLGPDMLANDNMTMLRPFTGSDRGRLALSVDISVVSYPNDSSVSYSRNEKHILSLPVDFRGMIALCISSAKTIEQALSNSTVSICTPKAVGAALSAVRNAFYDQARLRGLSSLLTIGLRPSFGCVIDFTFEVSQFGIKGPNGTFSVSSEQEGHAAVRILNSTATG